MKILVAGAGGFIGGHLTKRLVSEGHDVVAVDSKKFDSWYQIDPNALNLEKDLSIRENAMIASNGCEQVFNLAADMGGMGFIQNNKALCMLSVLINTHLLIAAKECGVKKYFFSSSACVYASWHQNLINQDMSLKEADAYPADPEDGYGWEKLFSERMCKHFAEDFGLEVRIGRYHNVYGPLGTYDGGREKAPAAAARKIARAILSGDRRIDIWGDGKQIRSFTYIDDCIEGTLLLMKSQFNQPLNIGSSESISIQNLYDITAEIAGIKNIEYSYDLNAPQGVRGRSSDNTLCIAELGWSPKISINEGMLKTYNWVMSQLSPTHAIRS
jgi:GDP-D-mannose 3',5'-epimerase